MQRMFIITYAIPGVEKFVLKTINNGVSEALFEANQIAALRVGALASQEVIGKMLLYDAFVEKIEILMTDM